MPVDWSQYLATNKTTDVLADGGTTRVQDASNGLGDLVSKIIQAQFGPQIAGLSTKITAEKPPVGTLAEYGGAAGDTIKLGNISHDMEISETVKGKRKGQTWNAQGGYVDTAGVLEGVADTMHELYHARTATAGVGGYKSSSALGSDWKDMLVDAGKAGFPSVTSALGGGDRLEEFLATAVTLGDMKNKNMSLTPGVGRMGSLPTALDTLSAKYKWLPAFIQENSNPTKPAKSPPSKGITGSILDFFK